MFVHQEYQDHHSEEEDSDLYEKIGSTDVARDDKFGSTVDKRRRELNDVELDKSRCNNNRFFKCHNLICVFFFFFSSLQTVCHTLVQLWRRCRPEEGSNQADEVPHETAHAAVCQGERLHQRYFHTVVRKVV